MISKPETKARQKNRDRGFDKSRFWDIIIGPSDIPLPDTNHNKQLT